MPPPFRFPSDLPGSMLKVIGAVYDAVQDGKAWSIALERLCHLVSAQEASLIWHEAGGVRTVITQTGIAAAWQRIYRDAMISADPWLAQAASLPEGHVTPGSTLVADRLLVRTAFHRNFLQPLGLRHACIAQVLKQPDRQISLVMRRAAAAESFGPAETELISTLLPHLRRAAMLAQYMDSLSSLGAATRGVLDRLHMGVLILDDGGSLLAVNQRGQEILAAGDGLIHGRDGLVAANLRQTEDLRRLICTARDAGDGPAALSLARLSQRRPYTVICEALPHESGGSHARRPAVALFICDPENAAETSHHLNERLYGLTRAEARLAQALTLGMSLDEAAQQFGLSKCTLRAQLRQIFAKTETSRQAELVRLLLTNPVFAARSCSAKTIL